MTWRKMWSYHFSPKLYAAPTINTITRVKCPSLTGARFTETSSVHSPMQRSIVVKSGGGQTSHSSVGEVVIITDESRNRNAWKLAVVEKLIV